MELITESWHLNTYHQSIVKANLSYDKRKLQLQSGRIAVRLRYAAINPADLNLITGNYGMQYSLPHVLGLEGCGEIIAVSDDLASLYQVGEQVIFLRKVGTWQTHAVVEPQDIFVLPQPLSSTQAAMLKVNPLTAWLLLQYMNPNFVLHAEANIAMQPQFNGYLVQNSANSAVGQWLAKLAPLYGVKTINLVRSEAAREQLKDLGFRHVLLDKVGVVEEIRAISDTISLAINGVGGDSALRLLNSLATNGRCVTYGAMSKRAIKLPNSLLIFRNIQLSGFWLTSFLQVANEQKVRVLYSNLVELIIQHDLAQPIAKIYPLLELKSALEHAQQSGKAGKILLQCS